MAEFTPFSAENDDDDDEELEQGSKKSSPKASSLGASILKSTEASTNTKMPEKPKGFDRIFAELSFAKKPEAQNDARTNEAIEPEELELPKPETAFEQSRVAETLLDHVDTEKPRTHVDVEKDFVFTTTPVAEEGNKTLPVEAQEASTGATYAESSNSAPKATAEPISPTALHETSVSESSRAADPFEAYVAAQQKATSSQSSFETPVTSRVTSEELKAPGDEVEDAHYEGRQQGRREGVLAGALLGGGIEHIRHRRREKRMNKAFETERTEHSRQLEDIQAQTEQDQAVRELRQAYEAKYSQTSDVAQESTPASVTSPLSPERPTAQANTTPSMGSGERVLQQDETIEIPREHHIERSAWLNVEVDERGNVVEDPTLTYGEEYYRERAQEIRADDAQDNDESSPKKPSESGHDYSVPRGAPTALGVFGGYEDIHASDHIRDSLQHGSTTSITPKKNLVQTLTSPPTSTAGTIAWTMALVVIVIIIALIIW